MAPRGKDGNRHSITGALCHPIPMPDMSVPITMDADSLAPYVTWGTSPDQASPITARVPDPSSEADPAKRARLEKSIAYMDLQPGAMLSDTPIDRVSSARAPTAGSRICDRPPASSLESMSRRASRRWLCRARPRPNIRRSRKVSDRIFRDAGFEWREAGLFDVCRDQRRPSATGRAVRRDIQPEFRRKAGPWRRTHLMSPAMAAAAAITGHLVDVRALGC